MAQALAEATAIKPGPVRRARQRAGSLARLALRVCRRSVRLVYRIAYYLLPPALHDLLRHCAPRICRRPVQQQLLSALRQRWSRWRAGAGQQAAVSEGSSAAELEGADPEANALLARYRQVYHLPETSAAEARHKGQRYRALASETRINRARICRELASLDEYESRGLAGSFMLNGPAMPAPADEEGETKRDPLTACMYGVRAMRLMGHDAHGDLEWVRPQLRAAGFAAEAEAARAMYGQHGRRDQLCRRLIESNVERCKQPPAPCEFVRYEDRRSSAPPRVSVIVSLYDAADKLPAFLQALQLQDLNRTGQMELILVDSNSPADEFEALRQTELTYPIPYLYVRTPARETIQTAWNRAIGLARAPYLSFLGADETVVPDALHALAEELDDDPDLDWVQGDSLITDVDMRGALVKDVMPYVRDGLTVSHVYLETCYLSWVGAMYRRSIHDRCGYYDGTFRGAGDTEFKCRVLPHLKIKHVPRMLGQFLNYPEARVTASPAAELEDLRAWYLYRTPAGVRHAFQRRKTHELRELLVLALRYRKSYLRRHSTDVEYADAVAQVLAERDPCAPELALAEGAAQLLQAYRTLDHLPASRAGMGKARRQALQTIAAVESAHRASHWLPQASYQIDWDNRREQHDQFW